MNLHDIVLGSGGALIVVMTLVQIVPIKINPWTWLANTLGKAFSKEVLNKVEGLSKSVSAIDTNVKNLEVKIGDLDTQLKALEVRVTDLDERLGTLEEGVSESKRLSEERYILSCRARILRFGDEILHSQKHSKEHFDQILLDCTAYENYCNEHPGFLNNITGQTIKIIEDTYRTCVENKSFL